MSSQFDIPFFLNCKIANAEQRAKEATDTETRYAWEEEADRFRKIVARIRELEADRDVIKAKLSQATDMMQRHALRVRELEEAVRVLAGAFRYVEQEVQMVADITRHAPLDVESQAKHDTTVYPCERLRDEILANPITKAAIEAAGKEHG